MKELREIQVLAQEKLTEDVYYLRLEKREAFLPGQLISLSHHPQDSPRHYSLASGTGDDHWGILYNRVEQGLLTPQLSQLVKGDPLYASSPFGEFLMPEGGAVWIGTGTGIAPFHGMIRSGLRENITLLHGARRGKDFYFRREFLEALGANYIPCATVEQGEGFYQGRLTAYLREEFDFPDKPYMLCGSTQMVITVRELLLEKGVPFDKIVSEIYF